MKKFLIGFSLVAMAGAGVALAQDHGAMGDPMGNKTVTRAEVQAKAEAHFAMMDVNKDGKLDAADRAAHMDQKFDAIDTNKNGAISKDEFAAARKDGHEGMPGMKHDGGHDRKGMGKGEHRMGGGGMMMLRMADTNKDGAVTKDEFVAAHLKMFDMADTNHDGQLTPAERKAARAKMMEHMRQMKGGMDHAGHDMAPPPPPPPAA